MKRIIMLGTVLVLILVSLGGCCFVPGMREAKDVAGMKDMTGVEDMTGVKDMIRAEDMKNDVRKKDK